MICRNCGCGFKEGLKRCPVCGTSITSINNGSAMQGNGQQQFKQNSLHYNPQGMKQNALHQNPQGMKQNALHPNGSAPQKGHGKKATLIISGAVVALLLLIGGIVYLPKWIGGEKTTESAKESTEDPERSNAVAGTESVAGTKSAAGTKTVAGTKSAAGTESTEKKSSTAVVKDQNDEKEETPDKAAKQRKDEQIQRLIADEDMDSEKYQYSSIYAKDWQKSYAAFVGKAWRGGVYYEFEHAYVPFFGYAIYDMDEDGIPELLVRCTNPDGMYSDDMFLGIYQYRNQKVECLDFCGERSVEYYRIPGNGMMNYRMYYHGKGILEVSKTELHDGKLEVSDLYSVNLRDDDPDGEKSPEEIVSGARLIRFVEGNCLLPIFDYYGVPETKSDCTNEEAKELIDDVIQNDGSIYYCFQDASFNNGADESNMKREYHTELVMNKTHFKELCSEGGLFDTECYVKTTDWRDLNGDGQDECVVSFGKKENDWEAWVVFSLQNGAVYAYYPRWVSIDCYPYSWGYYDLNNKKIDFRFYKDQFYCTY